MVWVELGSVVVVFGWVISVAIVLRVRRLHDVDDVLRVQLALVSRCVVGGTQLSPVSPLGSHCCCGGTGVWGRGG